MPCDPERFHCHTVLRRARKIPEPLKHQHIIPPVLAPGSHMLTLTIWSGRHVPTTVRGYNARNSNATCTIRNRKPIRNNDAFVPDWEKYSSQCRQKFPISEYFNICVNVPEYNKGHSRGRKILPPLRPCCRYSSALSGKCGHRLQHVCVDTVRKIMAPIFGTIPIKNTFRITSW